MNGEEQVAIAVQVGRLEANLENADRKLDAIHASLKDDLSRIEAQTTATNGRVTENERNIAVLKGVGLAIVALLPFGLYALQQFLMTP